MMNSRVAILDLGTNTFHLLIADTNGGPPVVVYQDTTSVRLGEGGISRGEISPEAFERGLEAVKVYKEYIDHYQVTTVKSAATSAIRSAKNGAEFIKQIRTETGIEIEVIDGEREAELIYIGVRAAINLEQKSLIVDIGGGSVEFIICDKTRIFWKESYPIGAARMMEGFHQTDPISREAISQLNNYLRNMLTDLQHQLDLHRPDLMVGSAGSFETFAELQHAGFKPTFERPEQTINLEKFRNISKTIITSTQAERRQMPEIPPVRVDMIVVATIITNYILNMCEFKSLKLSYYSLKEGVLFEMFE